MRVAGLALLLLAACAGRQRPPHRGPVPAPVAVVDQYLSALAQDHPEAAHRLLAPAGLCDVACLRRRVPRAQAQGALHSLREGAAVERRRLTLEGEVQLHRTPAGWRFATDPLDFYPQGTPEQALRSFLQILDRGRYPLIDQFLPQGVREALTSAGPTGATSAADLPQAWQRRFQSPVLVGILAAVRRHATEPFLREGPTEARLPLGDGKQVRMRLEQGRWVLVSLQ